MGRLPIGDDEVGCIIQEHHNKFAAGFRRYSTSKNYQWLKDKDPNLRIEDMTWGEFKKLYPYSNPTYLWTRSTTPFQ